MINHLISISVYQTFMLMIVLCTSHDKNIEIVEIKLQGDLNNAKHCSTEKKLQLNYNKFTRTTIGTTVVN